MNEREGGEVEGEKKGREKERVEGRVRSGEEKALITPV